MSQSRENLCTDRRTKGWTDGQTLFHRTLSAKAGGPITESTFSSPEFEPARKNNFIPSIPFWVPWPDWSHPFLTMSIQKNFWSAFNFCDHVSTCKKPVNLICSFFRYSQFLSPITRLATFIFDHAHTKKFQSPFNLCKIVPACKKSVPSFLSWDTANFRVQRPDC